MWLVLSWSLAAPLNVCPTPSAEGELQVMLVSAAPGWDAISSLGHTLLLVSGDGRAPTTYNYGAFDITQEGLRWKFVRGELRYFLAAWPWEPLAMRFMEQGRTVSGQRLLLSDDEARALVGALEAEESQEYRYDWGTANCSTKARDAVDAALGGLLTRAWDVPVAETPRREIRRHLSRFPARDLGWSFLAGPAVDVPMTEWDRALFPERLMRSLADAKRPDGRPLAEEACLLGRGVFDWPEERPAPTFPWAWPGLIAGWFGLGATFTKPSPSTRRVVGGMALLYGLFLTVLGTGTLGLSLLTTMRGAGPTWGWALAGPQSLLLVAAGVQVWRGRSLSAVWKGALVAMVGLALVGSCFVADGLALGLLPGLVLCVAAVWRGVR